MGAGALWGLVFLAPELTAMFNPLELAIGRYTAYGLMSAVLIAPRWRAMVARLGRGTGRGWRGWRWRATRFITLLGVGVQQAGIAITSPHHRLPARGGHHHRQPR
jgi:hypothetical protein